MRSPMMRQSLRSYTTVMVLMILAGAVERSQSQDQGMSQNQRRSEWQQGQSTPSLDGQPDFGQRMMERHARQMQEMQRDMEDMRRLAEESRNRAIQQAVRASDEQWRRIKPKLDHIERLKAEAEVSAGPNSGGGSGNFQGQGFMFGGGMGGGSGAAAFGSTAGGAGPADSSGNIRSNFWTVGPKDPMQMTPGENLCQELNHLLQGESVSVVEIAAKITTLRQIRAMARQDLAKARQELRTMIHPNQEPALVVMGYLD